MIGQQVIGLYYVPMHIELCDCRIEDAFGTACLFSLSYSHWCLLFEKIALQECPLGTFKNVSGSDRSLCHACPSFQLPHRAIYVTVRGIPNFFSSYFFVQKFSCVRYLTSFLIIYEDLEIVIDSLLVFMDICCLDLCYMISPVNFMLQFGRMSSLTSFNFYQVVLLRLHVHTSAFLTDITCQTVIQHLKNWYTLLVDRGCSVSFF